MIITKINLASFHTGPQSVLIVLEFGALVFVEGGKLENPERNPRRKARTNGDGRLAPSPLRHSCS